MYELELILKKIKKRIRILKKKKKSPVIIKVERNVVLEL